MKQFVITFFIAVASLTAISQKISPEAISKLSPGKKFAVKMYLRRADNAMIGGYSFVSTGLALMAIGFNMHGKPVSYNAWVESKLAETGSGEIFKLAGAVTTLFGIRCFVQVHKNRQTARAFVCADNGIMLSPDLLIPNTQSAGVKFIVPLGR